MSSKRFLITGATGASGATGGKTLELLLEQGYQVRAFVHKRDERSTQLEKRGVEVIVGDLLDFTTVRPALEDVAGAYFVYPIAPGLIEATASFAQAAKEARVPAIVNMSQISARREARSHAAFNHWMAERVFDWSGLAVTHLRPTFFAEGKIKPFIGRTYPLSETAQAWKDYESKRIEGKIVINVGNE